MEFREISKDEFKKFSDKHALSSFIQTVNMGNYQESLGNQVYYLGAFDNDKNLKAATLIFGIKARLGYYYNAPRGYLIDFEDKELLKFFNDNVVNFLKHKQGYILKIEPKILYQEHDINGDVVEGGFNNQHIVNNIIDLGFIHNGFYKELDLNKQVRWSSVLNFNGLDEKQIFKNFKGNTRNLIRKAIKHGVKVVELEYDDLIEFKKVVDSTGLRKNFTSRPLKYYQDMYKYFHDDGYVKFLAAKINLNEHLNILYQEKEDLIKHLNKLSDNKANDGKRKEIDEAMKGLNKKINYANEILKEDGENILLAGGMFMTYGNETVYLYSGSYDKYMNFYGQYLIQWEIIKYGINNGFKAHNFYGISGDFSKENKRHGVYEFKKSFNGIVNEYIGDFDYILNPTMYKIKKIFKRHE